MLWTHVKCCVNFWVTWFKLSKVDATVWQSGCQECLFQDCWGSRFSILSDDQCSRFSILLDDQCTVAFIQQRKESQVPERCVEVVKGEAFGRRRGMVCVYCQSAQRAVSPRPAVGVLTLNTVEIEDNRSGSSSKNKHSINKALTHFSAVCYFSVSCRCTLEQQTCIPSSFWWITLKGNMG